MARRIDTWLLVMLAWALSAQVQAIGISSWGVPQFTGYCGSGSPGTPGLPCAVKSGDVVDNPLGGTLTIGKVDTAETVRASIYDATGIDPGEVFQISKVDGSAGNTNGTNGLWLYDAVLTPIEITGNDNHGYWRYTGSELMKYLVVKAGTDFGIWDLSTLPTETVMLAGVATDVYKWDFSSARADGPGGSWVGVWDPLDDRYQKNMSHISLYGATSLGSVPIPSPLALMLVGLVALRFQRRRAR